MTSVARRADDDPDVGHEADVAVGNDVGVRGELDGDVFLDDRVSRRGLRGPLEDSTGPGRL